MKKIITIIKNNNTHLLSPAGATRPTTPYKSATRAATSSPSTPAGREACPPTGGTRSPTVLGT